MYYYALNIKYDGSDFSGFARQPGTKTVQGCVERALTIVLREEILTVCAGRTDAGVHARCQVASFSCITKIESFDKFLRSLNALVPGTISITKIYEVAENFSARFSARERIYKYYIYISKARPVFTCNFAWHISKSLDIEAMKQASQCLIGEHDFKSFCVSKSSIDKTTMRCVNSIEFATTSVADEELIEITISGNAFLHSMVRTIVGTLVFVGLKKREPSWVKDVLDAKDRSVAGECAPAKGLIFWDVIY